MPNEFKNKILSLVDPETIERLQLKRLPLEAGREIENPGEPIRNLFFIEDGIGSMTTTFADGFQVEVGMYGVESVMGASALIGTRRSLNKIYMQLAGYGFSCEMDDAKREFSRCERFHDLILRSVQAQLVQASQSVGCNSHHEVPQRLSRWLLLCADRSESPTLNLTHEYLSDMIGCSRPTVSTTAERLKQEGLIRYSRGKVTILDREGLERRSCECYCILRDHLASSYDVEQD